MKTIFLLMFCSTIAFGQMIRGTADTAALPLTGNWEGRFISVAGKFYIFEREGWYKHIVDTLYHRDSLVANKLRVARNINGVPFNGTQDITITASAVVDTTAGHIATQTMLSKKQDANTTVLVLPADTTTGANVTPIVLRSMIFNYVQNSVYTIDMYMSVKAAAATTGCGFQLDVSGAITMVSLTFTHQLANTGTQSGGSSIADNASVGVSSGIPSTNTATPVIGGGILVTGAGQSGTAQFMFRSETTAAITCMANSVIIVTKVK